MQKTSTGRGKKENKKLQTEIVSLEIIISYYIVQIKSDAESNQHF